MISKRCQGLNLLNHLKQKYDCNIQFELITDNNHTHFQKWLTRFEFKGKMYESVGNSKKEAINKIMEVAYDDIEKNIRIKV